MECTKVIGYKGLFHSESYQILLTLFLFIFEPFNRVDAISMHHDICYRDHGNSKNINVMMKC